MAWVVSINSVSLFLEAQGSHANCWGRHLEIAPISSAELVMELGIPGKDASIGLYELGAGVGADIFKMNFGTSQLAGITATLEGNTVFYGLHLPEKLYAGAWNMLRDFMSFDGKFTVHLPEIGALGKLDGPTVHMSKALSDGAEFYSAELPRFCRHRDFGEGVV